MNNYPTISVVIPCFNSQNTIEKCVNSVLNQTYSPTEIIVVDDGSTDNTVMLLEKIKERSPKEIDFYIFSQINSGPSVARNKAIGHAKGDWIAFLDSDDYWHIDNLLRAKEYIYLNPKYALIGGSLSEINTKKNILFNKLLYKNYFQTSTVLVKRKVMLKYLFNETQKYSEDYRSWLLITSENLACVLPDIKAYPIIEQKNSFSGTGLSSKLWLMELGELNNYLFLRKNKKISTLTFVVVSIISYLKFLKRYMINKYFK